LDSKIVKIDKFTSLFCDNDQKTNIGRKAVKGGVIVWGNELFSFFLRIISVSVLARLLKPEDFGLFAMVTALTVFAERFKDLGLADATVQAKEINREQASALFWINLSICIGIAFFLAIFSKAVAWFYNDPRLTAVTIVIALVNTGIFLELQILIVPLLSTYGGLISSEFLL